MSSILDTLITSRTGGHYGIDDLNRVGEAMIYVAARLRSCGWGVVVSPRTDWEFTDRVTLAEAQRYLDNLRKIWIALALFKTTPQLPDGTIPFNVQEANDIEQILIDIDKLLTLMAQTWIYSGAPNAYSGTNLYIATRTHLVTEGGDIILQENGEYLTLENAPDLPTWKGA